jgi:murein DD-endopeptidase MepM/ murein hydrolase activator NlpD
MVLMAMSSSDEVSALRIILALTAGLAFPACDRQSTEPEALPAITISVAPDPLILSVGQRALLVVTLRNSAGQPIAGRTVDWASSAPEVAAVSSAGLVTALAPGQTTITAVIDQRAGVARVVVQEDFTLPLPGGRHWLLLTEVGTPTGSCPAGEGGLCQDGGRDCSHAGVSRYSLDFAAFTQEEGALTGVRPVEVLAAADGTVIDVCLRPPTEITCGPNGPFVTVEHPHGFVAIYAHLDPASVTIRRKTPVRQGQPLGTMGAFGADENAWVHFELRFEGQGAQAASVLERLVVDGRRLTEYQVGPKGPYFYASTNAGSGHDQPDELSGHNESFRGTVIRRSGGV